MTRNPLLILLLSTLPFSAHATESTLECTLNDSGVPGHTLARLRTTGNAEEVRTTIANGYGKGITLHIQEYYLQKDYADPTRVGDSSYLRLYVSDAEKNVLYQSSVRTSGRLDEISLEGGFGAKRSMHRIKCLTRML